MSPGDDASTDWMLRALPALRRRAFLALVPPLLLIAAAVYLRPYAPTLPPYAVFFPGVLVSALFGGPVAGMIVTAVAVAIGATLFLPWPPGVEELVRTLSFLFVCGLTVWMVHILDSAVRRHNRISEVLEDQVHRLALALKVGKAGTFERIPPDQVIWDPTLFELVGLDPASAKVSDALYLSMVHPDDRERAEEDIRHLREGRLIDPVTEFRMVRADGETIWLRSHRVATAGPPRRIIGYCQDVTAQRVDEERLHELVSEVSHRVKNQYAVIMAIVREVARHSADVESFRDEVEARIYSLSRLHDLLVERHWRGAELRDVVQSQLAAFAGPGSWSLRGPSVHLLPKDAQYLAMAFFELATNAAKHGALTRSGGQVDISWAVAGPIVRIAWRETGGPGVGDLRQGGYGRRVLEQIVPGALGGRATITATPDGIVWVMEMSRSGAPAVTSAVA